MIFLKHFLFHRFLQFRNIFLAICLPSVLYLFRNAGAGTVWAADVSPQGGLLCLPWCDLLLLFCYPASSSASPILPIIFWLYMKCLRSDNHLQRNPDSVHWLCLHDPNNPFKCHLVHPPPTPTTCRTLFLPQPQQAVGAVLSSTPRAPKELKPGREKSHPGPEPRLNASMGVEGVQGRGFLRAWGS